MHGAPVVVYVHAAAYFAVFDLGLPPSSLASEFGREYARPCLVLVSRATDRRRSLGCSGDDRREFAAQPQLAHLVVIPAGRDPSILSEIAGSAEVQKLGDDDLKS